jgi:uncharacterized protein YegP (UPF0339 family)
MAAKFEIKQSESGKYHFNLKAGNGEPILSSQMYADKNGAKNGVESVKKNAADDGRFERKTAKDGSPYFVLKAANAEVIGTSEMYSSASAMENGIAPVKKNAPDAQVVEV